MYSAFDREIEKSVLGGLRRSAGKLFRRKPKQQSASEFRAQARSQLSDLRNPLNMSREAMSFRANEGFYRTQSVPTRANPNARQFPASRQPLSAADRAANRPAPRGAARPGPGERWTPRWDGRL